ncbi:hypothetical protein [Dysgonomonas mossii]|uniref:Uncharacterized protein n=1 Tax=Dysgonomonas mossii DSM 22836 TaxID=742767 RepID=F8X500_9BACT|nr:hypothetical protein [Dysgonomonas mossii]EGK04698.1 hypothetical protein HMPREF9456_03309 [Dysgonomonas mossii DSM 22836]
MKKYILLFMLLPFFISCSSDENEPMQDYTSFTLENKSSVDLPNVVIGYLTDGRYKKIADLGNINKGEISNEIRIANSSIKEIYVFFDYSDYVAAIRADISFIVYENKLNKFVLPSGIKGIAITDKTDPAQYPQ